MAKQVQAEIGVHALASQAMAEGATSDAIAEALRVAYQPARVGALDTAAAGLRDVFGEETPKTR